MASRDPKRIPLIIEQLNTFLTNNPDIRVGQILSNVASIHAVDVFYLEDTKLLDYLETQNRKQANPKTDILGRKLL